MAKIANFEWKITLSDNDPRAPPPEFDHSTSVHIPSFLSKGDEM